MAAFYVPLFLALLVGYLVTSGWAGFDPRYPFVLAGGLLAAAVGAEILGAKSTGNIFTEYVLLLIAGGVLLLAVDKFRRDSRSPAASDSPASLDSTARP